MNVIIISTVRSQLRDFGQSKYQHYCKFVSNIIIRSLGCPEGRN